MINYSNHSTSHISKSRFTSHISHIEAHISHLRGIYHITHLTSFFGQKLTSHSHFFIISHISKSLSPLPDMSKITQISVIESEFHGIAVSCPCTIHCTQHLENCFLCYFLPTCVMICRVVF